MKVKKKSFWGKGIVIFYVLFAVSLTTMAVLSTQNNFDTVSDDYYANSTKYQQDMNAIARAKKLIEKPVFKLTQRNLSLIIPDNLLNAKFEKLYLYSPSSKAEDQYLEVNKISNQSFSLSELRKGRWQLTLKWQHKKSDYILKEDIWLE